MILMNRFRKLVMVLVDVFLVSLSYLIGFFLYDHFTLSYESFVNFVGDSLVVSLIVVMVFFFMSLYNNVWVFAGLYEVNRIIGANIVAFCIIVPVSSLLGNGTALNVHIIAFVFMVILSGSFRFSFRLIGYYGKMRRKLMSEYKRVLIIGAGQAGVYCLRDMRLNEGLGYVPVAFVDDDASKLGSYVSGIRVVGNRDCIRDVVESMNIDLIMLGIASIGADDKREILNICKETGCEVKIMPDIVSLLNEKVGLGNLRKVKLEDLLGRSPVKLDRARIDEYIKGKVVLVTGGAGSIGSQLCRDILLHGPKELVVLDMYENGLFAIEHEFNKLGSDIKISYVVASIRDRRKLELVFSKYRPDVVFHAAALKHVPLMELNPGEAIKTNVLGTMKLAQVADMFGVSKFVMISSDKAVNPVNVMGATKRICEVYLTSLNGRSETEFVAVRFGNVLGSAGSVVPLFLDQIRAGGPVTITHKEITRFFMTIPEASELVLEAGAYARGGEVFVLDMGKPVKIYDLARDLIWLSGLRPDEDIEIKVTGLRPGEKLYEETLRDDEGLSRTANDMIFVSRPLHFDFDEMSSKVEGFIPLLEHEDREAILQQIESMVWSYTRFENLNQGDDKGEVRTDDDNDGKVFAS